MKKKINFIAIYKNVLKKNVIYFSCFPKNKKKSMRVSVIRMTKAKMVYICYDYSPFLVVYSHRHHIPSSIIDCDVQCTCLYDAVMLKFGAFQFFGQVLTHEF